MKLQTATKRTISPLRSSIAVSLVVGAGIAGLAMPAHADNGNGNTNDSNEAAAVVSPSTRESRAAALQVAVDRVNASELSEETKRYVIGALGSLFGDFNGVPGLQEPQDQIIARLEEIRAERFARMSERLLQIADRIDGKIADLAQAPGREDIIAAAKVKLEQARADITAATTATDLRVIYRDLRHLRRSLRNLESNPTAVIDITTTTVVGQGQLQG